MFLIVTGPFVSMGENVGGSGLEYLSATTLVSPVEVVQDILGLGSQLGQLNISVGLAALVGLMLNASINATSPNRKTFFIQNLHNFLRSALSVLIIPVNISSCQQCCG